MVKGFIRELKTTFILLFLFTLLCGILYPLIITGLSQLLFPWRANGSLIELNGKKIGSELIGQAFITDDYFWGRPSATTPFPYNPMNSMGSNLGPLNPELMYQLKGRIAFLRKKNPNNPNPIPIDLVTSSASGLDPDISILGAMYQVPRIAKARKMRDTDLYALINAQAKKRSLEIWGEPRVNVLQLNLSLLEKTKF